MAKEVKRTVESKRRRCRSMKSDSQIGYAVAPTRATVSSGCCSSHGMEEKSEQRSDALLIRHSTRPRTKSRQYCPRAIRESSGLSGKSPMLLSASNKKEVKSRIPCRPTLLTQGVLDQTTRRYPSKHCGEYLEKIRQ
ncbi:hypothetical protein DSL72_007462 [Monilinia vaccinii-corymbosi]|uniref:Uncharacterized protein n=1 Tax=Monilinia vaccinii-corymbosi TaxID=61207 RepID=A0A8A3PNC6_9HELO|nr:hypothetical protein DSL72_007462 [Monilinia vaccinii-corymbosi]